MLLWTHGTPSFWLCHAKKDHSGEQTAFREVHLLWPVFLKIHNKYLRNLSLEASLLEDWHDVSHWTVSHLVPERWHVQMNGCWWFDTEVKLRWCRQTWEATIPSFLPFLLLDFQIVAFMVTVGSTKDVGGVRGKELIIPPHPPWNLGGDASPYNYTHGSSAFMVSVCSSCWAAAQGQPDQTAAVWILCYYYHCYVKLLCNVQIGIGCISLIFSTNVYYLKCKA